MKIPYKLNPFGKSQSGGIPTKGLDFYLPLENDMNDTVNSLTGTQQRDYYSIQTDTYSTIGKYLKCNNTSNTASYALHFDGSENLCQYGTGDFTISFWLHAPEWNSYREVIFSKKGTDSQTGIVIYRDTGRSNAITCRIGAGSSDIWTTTDVANDKWVHWLYQRKDGVGYWYKNGALNASGEQTGDSTNTSEKIYFGWNTQWSTAGYFNLKSFRIYNRALSISEITALSNEFDIKYFITANETQTFRFTPVNNPNTKNISYSTRGTITNFEIISGELPSSITFNTSTGKFSGKALTDADHTYNLVVRMTGNDVITKDINVTINTVATTELSITSPQTFNFTTEKAITRQTIQYNHETYDYGYYEITQGNIPSGCYINYGDGYDYDTGKSGRTFYLNSYGNQTSSFSQSFVFVVHTDFHPTPVSATINVNVTLNQITADNINFKVYSADGAKSKQVTYNTQNPITPVYSLSGTLPTGFSFDSQTGTFSYDGVTTTATSGEVQVTINSSTGCSTPATITATLELIEGTTPWEAPTEDLVFYDSLKTTASWTTPEIGSALTINGSSPTLTTENGIECSYFNNGALSQNNVSYITQTNHDLSMSIWVKCAETTTNFAGIFSIGRWRSNQCIQLCQNLAIIKFISCSNNDIFMNNVVTTEWHHVVLTYNSSTHKANVYVDKTHIAEANNSTSPYSVLAIAANANSTAGIPRDSYFNGYLAGVRLYNKVLTTEEINILGQEFTPTT